MPPPRRRRSTTTRQTALALLVLLASVVLIACNDNGDGDAAAADRPSGVTTDVPTPRPAEATTAPDATLAPEPSEEQQPWAVAFCEATALFDEVTEAVEDGVDPRTLDLDPRRERGADRYERHVEGLRDVQAALQEIAPPDGAVAYHRATIEQTEILIDRMTESIVFLREAASHEAIEEELELLMTEVMMVEDAVRAIREDAPPEIRRALDLAPQCGQILG